MQLLKTVGELFLWIAVLGLLTAAAVAVILRILRQGGTTGTGPERFDVKIP